MFIWVFLHNKPDKENPDMATEKPQEYFFRVSMQISLKKGVRTYTHGRIIGKTINPTI